MSDREDDILERVLQRVDHPGLEDPGLDLKGDERRLWREYTELSGLLPYALEPVAPRAGRRDELLASARRERFPQDSQRESVRPGASPAPLRHNRRRLSVAMAAALAALSLGLALASGWLARDRALQQRTITALERQLHEIAGTQAELRDTRAELARLRGVFTSAGMRVCPLRPWGERPAQPVARAAVYFDGDRQQWFLAARDLEPCRQGSYYVLWFVVDGKPVAGGSFRPEKGVPVALAAERMPGEMSGAFLTLEPDPAVGAPTGPPILYGEQSEEML
ncbi:MAG TPA: anti-sigma factor [Thermoanaerobaculia bacterium]|nr:anti-sigma factor [Thermoanaerobaculia bacterium]